MNNKVTEETKLSSLTSSQKNANVSHVRIFKVHPTYRHSTLLRAATIKVTAVIHYSRM